MEVTPVRRAYEQVADQLREMIVSGTLTVGDRLPTEAELCTRFRTSRSTVREALRLLSSQSLITTRAGAKGGSSVAQPDMAVMSNFLRTTLSLLAGTGELSICELLEARELLEVPAARMAAARDNADDTLAQLERFSPEGLANLPTDELYRVNSNFHQTIVASSGNRILQLMGDPLFRIMQDRFLRDRAGENFWRAVEDDHEQIVAAFRAKDSVGAGEAMSRHLKNLAPLYTAIDRELLGSGLELSG